eukprot:6414282-Pyramimonas_sp.AAC.1
MQACVFLTFASRHITSSAMRSMTTAHPGGPNPLRWSLPCEKEIGENVGRKAAPALEAMEAMQRACK